MDLNAIRSRLDQERRTLVRRSEVVEVAGPIVRRRGADHSWHSVEALSLTADGADDIISREIEHHRRAGVPFEWKVYSYDSPPDLVEKLSSRGFYVGPREAVMVYDLLYGLPMESLGAGRGDGPAPTSGVALAGTGSAVQTFREVAEKVFGKNYQFTTLQLLAELEAGSTDHQAFVSYEPDRVPAAIGRLYTHADSAFGGLYGGGTLPAFRGRGHYFALVRERARRAIALGAQYLIVDALPTSRPILERLGFQRLADTWPCQRSAPPTG